MERVRLARDTSQPLGLLSLNKELVRVLREVTLTKKETHRQRERERERGTELHRNLAKLWDSPEISDLPFLFCRLRSALASASAVTHGEWPLTAANMTAVQPNQDTSSSMGMSNRTQTRFQGQGNNSPGRTPAHSRRQRETVSERERERQRAREREREGEREGKKLRA